MSKFEYQEFIIHEDPVAFLNFLKHLGLEEWELVAIREDTIICKRVIEEES